MLTISGDKNIREKYEENQVKRHIPNPLKLRLLESDKALVDNNQRHLII